MKFLFLLLVLVIAYSAWRAARVRDAGSRSARRGPTAPALPQDMVSCPVCGLHLPRAEAVAGTTGRLYCGPEHRHAGGN